MEKDNNYIVKFFEKLNWMGYDYMEAIEIKEEPDYIWIKLFTEELDYSAKDNTLTISNSHASRTLEIDDNYIVDISYCWYWDREHQITFWKKDKLQNKKIGE